MIHIAQAIVVEGKYDKIKLSSILDAVILVTNGFRIFRDPEKMALIQYYARTTGVIVLTDSDRAGFQIRNYLKGAVRDGKLYHVYIPDIYGKEHRKEKPSAEGKLGVEGIRKDVLLEAFAKAGVLTNEVPEKADPITRYDLYELGLSGGADSKARRKALQKRLGLPDLLSAASLLEVLNTMMTRQELQQLLADET
ncbi:MAG: toprim domain-containing protein [Ruminococcus sp.]